MQDTREQPPAVAPPPRRSPFAVRRALLALVLAWGLGAVALLASGATGAWASGVIAPFMLFGAGVAMVASGFWNHEGALRIAVAAGGGISAVIVVSQLLVLTGDYSPQAIAGILTAAVALMWAVMEVKQWTTRS
ncbi:hypothetical protein ACQ3I4_12370 [Zafaria sp. Z1313]|uniref:hypothetical protein n=1 Tax=unclassified Zafaria TaxID=2828765 RepID=UPI002E787E9C|nr:hypothetical protein [Zafaria sp. J156]MEE1620479.1 hypothetical protein [Zafaria sp. J156]